jgi:hypothetical protein
MVAELGGLSQPKPRCGKPRSREDGREEEKKEIRSAKNAKEPRTPRSRIFLLGVLCSFAPWRKSSYFPAGTIRVASGTSIRANFPVLLRVRLRALRGFAVFRNAARRRRPAQNFLSNSRYCTASAKCKS